MLYQAEHIPISLVGGPTASPLWGRKRDATARRDPSRCCAGSRSAAYGAQRSCTRSKVDAAILNLSERGLLIEAAANLFAHLRALDGRGVGAIAAMPIPEEGLGEAINDRLRHAAAPRDLADGFDETDRRTAIPCSD